MKIYLVHNIIRKNSAIKNICKAFGFDSSINEIYSQKKGVLNCINYLETRLILLGLELGQISRSSGGLVAGLKIKLILSEIKDVIIFFLVWKKRKELLVRAWVVYSISSKHIRAWKKISTDSAPYGLIFEDDVVSRDDSAAHLAELLKIVDQMGFNGYLDLAGGYEVTELFNEVKVLHQLRGGSKLISPHPPRSNTACGYLLSREMAKSFISALVRNKKIRFMPIDFIMNYCLGVTVGPKYQCLHVYPSVLQHGSFLGLYKTWDA